MADFENQDSSSKTEQPSRKKIDDSLKKGHVAVSKEITNFLLFLLITISMIWVIPVIIKNIAVSLKFFIVNAGSIIVNNNSINVLLVYITQKTLLYTGILFIIIFFTIIFSIYFQHGELIFTTEQITFDFAKLSIIAGFKRLLSIKNLVEFIKNIIKVSIIAFFIYVVIRSDIGDLTLYQEFSVYAILIKLKMAVCKILGLITVIMAVIGIIDYGYQKYTFLQQMKMTRQEVQEENKQTEGNPEIKRKIKSLRQQQSHRIITDIIPKSTVVITNPTHYAVVLQYEVGVNSAPVCVYKGLDFLAQKIKKIAKEYNVPIVENPSLAQVLYKNLKIDQEIPVEYYGEVSKIIAYVMSLNNKNRKF